MSYQTDLLKTLFRKVLRGTASVEEQDIVRQYIAREQPDLDLLLPFEDWDTEEAGSGMRREEMEAWLADIVRAETSKPEPRRLTFKRWLPYAAALVAGITAIFLLKNNKVPNEEVTWMHVKTPRAKQMQVWLPDSSRVTLNAGTELRYPQHFEKGKRQVYLSGEAFFEVRPDASRPFSVHTPLLTVSVLGTSFNVQAYAEDHHIAVAVKTGKVKVAPVRQDGNTNILKPGQAILYNKSDQKTNLIQLDTATVAQWRSHRISLEDATLAGILKVIERTYDVQFHTDEPELLQRRYSVTFYDMKLQEVLDKLAYLGTLSFTKKGNQITIREQR